MVFDWDASAHVESTVTWVQVCDRVETRRSLTCHVPKYWRRDGRLQHVAKRVQHIVHGVAKEGLLAIQCLFSVTKRENLFCAWSRRSVRRQGDTSTPGFTASCSHAHQRRNGLLQHAAKFVGRRRVIRNSREHQRRDGLRQHVAKLAGRTGSIDDCDEGKPATHARCPSNRLEIQTQPEYRRA